MANSPPPAPRGQGGDFDWVASERGAIASTTLSTPYPADGKPPKGWTGKGLSDMSDIQGPRRNSFHENR
jgi:hypothetical protein